MSKVIQSLGITMGPDSTYYDTATKQFVKGSFTSALGVYYCYINFIDNRVVAAYKDGQIIHAASENIVNMSTGEVYNYHGFQTISPVITGVDFIPNPVLIYLPLRIISMVEGYTLIELEWYEYYLAEGIYARGGDGSLILTICDGQYNYIIGKDIQDNNVSLYCREKRINLTRLKAGETDIKCGHNNRGCIELYPCTSEKYYVKMCKYIATFISGKYTKPAIRDS